MRIPGGIHQTLQQEQYPNASQELVELPDGEVRLRLRLNNLAEAERWVLSWWAARDSGATEAVGGQDL